MKITTPTIPFIKKLQPLWRYRVVMFIVFIAGLSIYLILQINNAINVAAQTDEVSAGNRTPRIDPALIQQLQRLEDNSVSVQSLFNEARENPFSD